MVPIYKMMMGRPTMRFTFASSRKGSVYCRRKKYENNDNGYGRDYRSTNIIYSLLGGKKCSKVYIIFYVARVFRRVIAVRNCTVLDKGWV